MDRRTLYVDVDDTLLLHDLSEHRWDTFAGPVEVECNGRVFEGVPHQKNIKLLIKFYKLGYDIIVWSKTGKTWAEEVCKTLNIGQYVSTYLTKPDFYLDDKPVGDWIGPRIWRDPKSGREA
jgi:hypothetical protein